MSNSNWFLYGQLQAGKDLQYGRVSPAELVQAVQEMLSAAGIYMDVEKQSLLQKTITLQEQLKESQTSLLLEQVCDNYASFAVLPEENVCDIGLMIAALHAVLIDKPDRFQSDNFGTQFNL